METHSSAECAWSAEVVKGKIRTWAKRSVENKTVKVKQVRKREPHDIQGKLVALVDAESALVAAAFAPAGSKNMQKVQGKGNPKP